MGLLETSLNNLLFRDRSMKAARQRLVGKSLRVELQEFPSSFVLLFSEQSVDVLGQSEYHADCTVKTRVPVLLKLRDRQQLSSLIRNSELIVEGDIHVVQQLMGLLDLLQWDPGEWLAPYVGDIVAQSVTEALSKGAGLLKRALQHQQRYIGEALTQEWRLAPGALEVAWFNEEAEVMTNKVDALIARFNKLEASR